MKLLGSIRPNQIVPETPQNSEPRTGLSMGEHAAITAKEWGITREAQDELAATSHQRLAAAYDRGFFSDLITPYLGLQKDNNLRADSTAEGLAKLKPVFGKGEGAHDDRRQLHAAHRRCGHRPARQRGVGRRAQPAGARLPDPRAGHRRRLHPRRRGPADGPDLRRAADARQGRV